MFWYALLIKGLEARFTQLIAKFEGCHHDVLNETVMYHATDTVGNSPLVTTIYIIQIKLSQCMRFPTM